MSSVFKTEGMAIYGNSRPQQPIILSAYQIAEKEKKKKTETGLFELTLTES